VYRAWDPVLQREIAVKLLLPSGLDAEQEFLSVVSEARAIARVRHPHIVSVYGVDRRDGRVGFWSDYVRGRTLASLVETEGPLSVEEIARIGCMLCDALGAVHGAGLLHRDIKASNAMRDEGGNVLLMDFGLSSELHRAALPAGTPKYMAPELRAGGQASVQSDVYAMGVLLLYLKTGRYPITESGGDAGKVWGSSTDKLDEVLRRATAADAGLRYASAGRFGEALAPLRPKGELGSRRVWKNLLWATGLVAALCVGVMVTPQFRSLVLYWIRGAPPASGDYLAAVTAMYRYDKPGNIQRAIDLYKSDLMSTPDDALAEAGLARAYWQMYDDTRDLKWIDEADKESDRAFALNPNLAAVEMTAGMLHVDQGNAAERALGLEQLQKAVALDNTSPDIHAALGEAYRKQHRFDQAKVELQKAVDLAPDDWRWPYLLGAMEFEAGDLKTAEESFNLALSKTKDNAVVLYDAGVLYVREKRRDEAWGAFHEAARLAPNRNTELALGFVELLSGAYADAAQAYKRAIEFGQSSWFAWGSLASAYEWSGADPKLVADTYGKAISLGLQALEKTPGDQDLISQLGNYYASTHQAAKALPLLRKAMILAPGDPDIVARVGTSYEELGQREEALKLIGQALKLGFSVDYARKTPALSALRHDPRAPQEIRD
jgi:serine/threonine protein kinase/Tfp pilus assembly protein PilF